MLPATLDSPVPPPEGLQQTSARSGSDLALDLDQLVRDLARADEENRQRKLYGRSQDSATNSCTTRENA